MTKEEQKEFVIEVLDDVKRLMLEHIDDRIPENWGHTYLGLLMIEYVNNYVSGAFYSEEDRQERYSQFRKEAIKNNCL
jgi:hypothetical protein